METVFELTFVVIKEVRLLSSLLDLLMVGIQALYSSQQCRKLSSQQWSFIVIAMQGTKNIIKFVISPKMFLNIMENML